MSSKSCFFSLGLMCAVHGLLVALANFRAIGFVLRCAKGWKSYDRNGRPLGFV